MARIEGVNLPNNKTIEFGLQYVFGIGPKISRDILNKLKIELTTRVKDLNDDQVAAIQREVNSSCLTEGELRKEIQMNIRRLADIGSVRGLRHKRGLPVRGQRTRTNARTRKGPRRAGSAISLKKAATKK